MIFIYLGACWFWQYLNNVAGVPTNPVKHFKSFFLIQSIYSKNVFKNLAIVTCDFPRGGGACVLCILIWILCIHFMNVNGNKLCFYYSLHSLAVKNDGMLRASQGNFWSFWMSCWFLEQWMVDHWRDMPHRRHLWQSPQRSSSPVILFFLSWEGFTMNT